MQDRDGAQIISIPWALQMNAVSSDEPSRLVPDVYKRQELVFEDDAGLGERPGVGE